MNLTQEPDLSASASHGSQNFVDQETTPPIPANAPSDIEALRKCSNRNVIRPVNVAPMITQATHRLNILPLGVTGSPQLKDAYAPAAQATSTLTGTPMKPTVTLSSAEGSAGTVTAVAVTMYFVTIFIKSNFIIALPYGSVIGGIDENVGYRRSHEPALFVVFPEIIRIGDEEEFHDHATGLHEGQPMMLTGVFRFHSSISDT